MKDPSEGPEALLQIKANQERITTLLTGGELEILKGTPPSLRVEVEGIIPARIDELRQKLAEEFQKSRSQLETEYLTAEAAEQQAKALLEAAKTQLAQANETGKLRDDQQIAIEAFFQKTFPDKDKREKFQPRFYAAKILDDYLTSSGGRIDRKNLTESVIAAMTTLKVQKLSNIQLVELIDVYRINHDYLDYRPLMDEFQHRAANYQVELKQANENNARCQTEYAAASAAFEQIKPKWESRQAEVPDLAYDKFTPAEQQLRNQLQQLIDIRRYLASHRTFDEVEGIEINQNIARLEDKIAQQDRERHDPEMAALATYTDQGFRNVIQPTRDQIADLKADLRRLIDPVRRLSAPDAPEALRNAFAAFRAETPVDLTQLPEDQRFIHEIAAVILGQTPEGVTTRIMRRVEPQLVEAAPIPPEKPPGPEEQGAGQVPLQPTEVETTPTEVAIPFEDTVKLDEGLRTGQLTMDAVTAQIGDEAVLKPDSTVNTLTRQFAARLLQANPADATQAMNGINQTLNKLCQIAEQRTGERVTPRQMLRLIARRLNLDDDAFRAGSIFILSALGQISKQLPEEQEK